MICEGRTYQAIQIHHWCLSRWYSCHLQSVRSLDLSHLTILNTSQEFGDITELTTYNIHWAVSWYWGGFLLRLEVCVCICCWCCAHWSAQWLVWLQSSDWSLSALRQQSDVGLMRHIKTGHTQLSDIRQANINNLRNLKVLTDYILSGCWVIITIIIIIRFMTRP